MFEEYQNIIIAAAAVIVVIIALLVVMKLKKKKPSAFDADVDFSQAPSKPKKAPAMPSEPAVAKKVETPAPKEEVKPEPVPVKEEVVKQEAPILKEEPKESVRKPKREVPAHGKMAKQDFAIFAGNRILVAEDNMINQKVIKGLIGDIGIDIVIADDGQIALDILEKDSDFVFVLMDAHMPNVDGFEATRQIRANPKYDDILVVALSGDTAADDIRKMREAGMEEQLAKPLKVDALYDIFYAYAEINEGGAQSAVVEEKKEESSAPAGVLDTEKGLATCGGDRDFYCEILSEFLGKYENAADQLDDLIIDGELGKVNEVLHDIIGVAANIGADKFYEYTTQMKESIKQSEGESYGEYSETYRDEVAKLMKEIKDYI